YIAPQLWASREGRMKKLRGYVDRLACIFPFEEAYFRGRGVNATFVGHPLFDEMPTNRTPPPGPRFPEAAPVIGIIPGSRRTVVDHDEKDCHGEHPGRTDGVGAGVHSLVRLESAGRRVCAGVPASSRDAARTTREAGRADVADR